MVNDLLFIFENEYNNYYSDWDPTRKVEPKEGELKNFCIWIIMCYIYSVCDEKRRSWRLMEIIKIVEKNRRIDQSYSLLYRGNRNRHYGGQSGISLKKHLQYVKTMKKRKLTTKLYKLLYLGNKSRHCGIFLNINIQKQKKK